MSDWEKATMYSFPLYLYDISFFGTSVLCFKQQQTTLNDDLF